MEIEQRIAELEAVIAALRAENAALRAENAALKAKLGQNSSNSSKPPSSDSPADRELRSKGKKSEKRRRGGQPGHRKHERSRVPREELSASHDVFPEACAGCGLPLPADREVDPAWHQVTELPQVRPVVTEWRLHEVACSCGTCTRAQLPTGVPTGAFGPNLVATVGLLTGVHNVTRRNAQALMAELFGLEISLGAISNCERRLKDALVVAVEDAVKYALGAAVKHIDATSWLLNHKIQQLWTVATSLVTVFFITADGTAATLKDKLGEAVGLLVSDRATVFGFWAMSDRQVCWAHLVRKFVAFRQMEDQTAAGLGEDLVKAAKAVFRLWWRMKGGDLTREEVQKKARRHRTRIENLLERGEALGIVGVSGSCADMLAHQPALWTFIDTEGVEPTNNLAERELRRLVLARKISFGSQSIRGCHFTTYLATVARTIAAQRRAGLRDGRVLDYLSSATRNALLGLRPPALTPPLPDQLPS